MTETLPFLFACLALLAAPGPTNALLAAAGASAGFRRGLAGVAAAVAGYAIAIPLLLAVAGPVIATAPLFLAALKGAACLILARAAIGLWRSHAGAARGTPGAGTIFVTTLLNPKSLVFAFALLPQRPLADLVIPHLVLLAAAIALVSAGWLGAGALATGQRANRGRAAGWINRGSALVVAAFAAMLAADASLAIAGAIV